MQSRLTTNSTMKGICSSEQAICGMQSEHAIDEAPNRAEQPAGTTETEGAGPERELQTCGMVWKQESHDNRRKMKKMREKSIRGGSGTGTADVPHGSRK